MEVIDAYIFIKRFVAQSDGTVDPDEWAHIIAGLRQEGAALGVPARDIPAVLDRVDRRFMAVQDDPAAAVAVFRACVATLRAALDEMPEARRNIIEQLWDLAAADGWIDDMESHFISEAERHWA